MTSRKLWGMLWEYHAIAKFRAHWPKLHVQNHVPGSCSHQLPDPATCPDASPSHSSPALSIHQWGSWTPNLGTQKGGAQLDLPPVLNQLVHHVLLVDAKSGTCASQLPSHPIIPSVPSGPVPSAPCSTKRPNLVISDLRFWIVSRALCSFSWEASRRKWGQTTPKMPCFKGSY